MASEIIDNDDGFPWLSWALTGVLALAGVLVVGLVISAKSTKSTNAAIRRNCGGSEITASTAGSDGVSAGRSGFCRWGITVWFGPLARGGCGTGRNRGNAAAQDHTGAAGARGKQCRTAGFGAAATRCTAGQWASIPAAVRHRPAEV